MGRSKRNAMRVVLFVAFAVFCIAGLSDWLDQESDGFPHARIGQALDWIDRHGDSDGDGFVEYHRRSGDGLVHQGWKDSDDAIFHADGSPTAGPIKNPWPENPVA